MNTQLSNSHLTLTSMYRNSRYVSLERFSVNRSLRNAFVLDSDVYS